jgi:hypothetical protein
MMFRHLVTPSRGRDSDIVVDRPAGSATAAVGSAAADARSGEIPRATFGDVFAVGEFRVLWLAQLLSVAGDLGAALAAALAISWSRKQVAALTAD